MISLPMPSSLIKQPIVKMANKEGDVVDVAERKQTKTKTKKWNDKEIYLLIDYLEEHPSFSKDYHLKDKRDKAYEVIKEEMDIPIADIQCKIVGLRS